MGYECGKCGRQFAQLTVNECCDNPACNSRPLRSIRAGSDPASGYAEAIEGLCILVCDVSASMDEPALAGSAESKLALVTLGLQRAILELASIAKDRSAYIAIVAFGTRAALLKDREGRPFIKSVRSIVDEFDLGLGEFLFYAFKNDRADVDRSYTNLSDALRLARSIADDAISNVGFSKYGIQSKAKIMKQSDILTSANKQLAVPNVRVMAYSDGFHNQQALINPFERMNPSLLMTAFIGDEKATPQTQLGAKQMESLATTCPVHGRKGFFLINSLSQHARLRDLFRMASGASGFCPDCLQTFKGGTIQVGGPG